MTDLYDSAGRKLPATEAPTEERLRAYGDAAFLFMRSPRNATMPMEVFRAAMEPPLVLSQYRVFRFDGVPRAMMTWGWLSRDAEKRFVAGEVLDPEDWRSGDHLWLIDLVAPYRGLSKNLGRWLVEPGNFSKDEFWYRRVTGENITRKIVHVRLNRPDDKAEILSPSDFA